MTVRRRQVIGRGPVRPAGGSDIADDPMAADHLAAVARLPSPRVERWVARRKAQVLAAVRDGQLSLEDACRLYALSTEEFNLWQRRFERFGLEGLRVRGRRRS